MVQRVEEQDGIESAQVRNAFVVSDLKADVSTFRHRPGQGNHLRCDVHPNRLIPRAVQELRRPPGTASKVEDSGRRLGEQVKDHSDLLQVVSTRQIGERLGRRVLATQFANQRRVVDLALLAHPQSLGGCGIDRVYS